MHISEGVLNLPVLVAGWGIAVAGLGIGLKHTAAEKMSKVAVLSALIFLASLVHVPVGPASIHLTLLGIMGALLGWSVIPAVFIALLLQALLFQFGGIVVLGVNTVTLGGTALMGFAIYRYLPKKLPQGITYFLTGFIPILLGSLMLVLVLFLSDNNLKLTAKLIFAANVPLAVVEGIITLFAMVILKKMLPEYAEY